MTRATRRHHAARVIRLRVARSGWWASHIPPGRFRKWNQTCSCWACRPPRSPSISDRKAPTMKDWA